MSKQIVFIGSNFEELILKNNVLKMSFVESLWASFATINSEVKFDAFINQLKIIENKFEYLRKNEQFLSLIKNIKTDLDYDSIVDSNERLILFKRLLSKSLSNQYEQVDEELRNLLGSYLANSEYIFSYNSNFLIENIIQVKSEVIACTDRQSFLLSKSNLGLPILYKLYGSFDQVETIALTSEEKQESMINLRMGISKINQFEDISVTLLGFNEEDDEFNNILNELSLKNKAAKVSLFKPFSHEYEAQQRYIDHQTGLKIDVIISDFQTYLREQLQSDNKLLEMKLNSTDQSDIQGNSSSNQIVQMSRSRKKKLGDKNISLKIPHKILFMFAGILFCTLIFNFVFSVATIKGESMAPNFRSSDYIVLNKQYNKVERFDVVAFKSPDEHGQEYIKRVIGLPGDKIEYVDDQLYINGTPIEETYLDREKKKLGDGEVFTKDFSLEELSGVKEVPKNKLFVLGDNRLYSRDSRNFGFVDIKAIKGNVKWKIWSTK
ncbi:signal peptidase I [Enterococcus sp. DIV0840]|uniref:signal peptidase I n=1 Tax=unclassified Enterococcus TaxID=2608891 RepID=UPI001A8C050B|nr:signal peptidase I [Enterococcus sp. DIV0849a]MBO0435307.1 signal peptidase I [Enterococcus sp. DIV0849a]